MTLAALDAVLLEHQCGAREARPADAAHAAADRRGGAARAAALAARLARSARRARAGARRRASRRSAAEPRRPRRSRPRSAHRAPLARRRPHGDARCARASRRSWRASRTTPWSWTCARSPRTRTSAAGRARGRRSMTLDVLEPHHPLACRCSSPLLPLPVAASAQEVKRRVGTVTVRVDETRPIRAASSRCGSASRGRLGAACAILDGRRAPFYSDGGGCAPSCRCRSTTAPGPTTLGVDVAARGGASASRFRSRRRARVPRPHVYLREEKRALMLREAGACATRAGCWARYGRSRRLPRPARSRRRWRGLGSGFGDPRNYTGMPAVEKRVDAISGEYHRGLDYPVPPDARRARPPRAPCSSPARSSSPASRVVIDHGQGVVSVFYHLGLDAAARGRRRWTPAPSSAAVGRDRDRRRPAPALGRLRPRRGRRPAGAGAAA